MKLIQRILFVVLAISTAFVCLSFGIRREDSPVFALNTTEDGNYYLGGGDVVFTVEKVGVAVDASNNYNLFTPMSTNSSWTNAWTDNKYVINSIEKNSDGSDNVYYNKPQYYIDIANGSMSKTIIQSGSVVKLNNDEKDSVFVNDRLNAYQGDIDGTDVRNVKVSEAIMISFGQFVYDTTAKTVAKPSYNEVETGTPPDITTNVETSTDKITWPGKATLEHNGTTREIDIRRVTTNEGTYYDFSMIITQDESSSGYYKININNYMKGGEEFSLEFDFFVIFSSSYNRVVRDDPDDISNTRHQDYTAYPTISWKNETSHSKSLVVENKTDKETTGAINGFARYYMGQSGVVTESIKVKKDDSTDSKTFNNTYYPILTYDYTKYSLYYTHTANNKSSTYSYSFDPKAVEENFNGNITNAPIVLTKESGDKKETITYNLADKYSKTRDNNLVSIILTEPGSYRFYYDYIYTGYVPNGKDIPTVNDQVEVTSSDLAVNLFIHGFELEYSRYEYTEAELKHIIIANASDNVGCIVPNGVEISKVEDYKNTAIDFTYEFDKNKDTSGGQRVGTVINNNSKQGLIQLSDDSRNTILTLDTEDIRDIPYAPPTGTDGYETTRADIDELLSPITYTNTNQGSLWFKYNDTFVVSSQVTGTEDGKYSKYLYSPTEISNFANLKRAIESTTNPLEIKDFTNETTFNKTGYYLVFIRVQPKDLSSIANSFWQVYAFKYTTDTLDINVHTAVDKNGDAEITATEGDIVGAGKFTSEDVIISWKDPDVFERKIEASFYTTTDPKASINRIMSSSVKYTLRNGMTLGTEVSRGQYKKYLLVLENVGGSKTYRMFTIDRQDISGVQAFAVSKHYTENGYYYTATTDRQENKIRIINGITDSMATLDWNDKPSGAKIYAEYTFTPFISDVSAAKKQISTSQELWYTTHYSLGDTIGLFDFANPESFSSINYNTSIIEDQGIYLFTITDEAGNSCQYIIIIDKTESYFKINEDFMTAASKIYSTNTTIHVSSHKAINLGELEETTANKNLVNILKGFVNGTTYETYYKGTDSNNASELQRMLAKNGENYYLKVRNSELNIYNLDNILLEKREINKKDYTYEMKKDGASSVRRFYIVGENNKYSGNLSSALDSKSYLQIEINTDNSRGMVLALSDNENFESVESITEDVILDTKKSYRLYTGSDGYDASGEYYDGLTGTTIRNANGTLSPSGAAEATSANKLIFTWLVGKGIYEVGTVSYKYYAMDTKNFVKPTEDSTTNYYYYSFSEEVMVYENNAINSLAGGSMSSTRGMVKLYSSNKDTAEGLYVFTRIYKGEEGVDYGDDKKELKYYFVVDKNGIYSIDDEARDNIVLKVLGGEESSSTNEFSGGFDVQTLNYNDNTSYQYKSYYTTGKVPALFEVPMAKYITSSANSSMFYSAGRLSYELYFIDQKHQLNENGDIKLLCSGDANVDSSSLTAKINVGEELDLLDREKMLVKDGEKDWLALPGRYVLILKDKVRLAQSRTTNYIGIGFDILEGRDPNINFETGYDEENTVQNNNIVNEYDSIKNATITHIYTSDEIVKFTLPKYEEGNIKDPKVDPDYFVVLKNGARYLEYKYDLNNSFYAGSKLSASDLVSLLDENGKTVISTTDGARTIFLDTEGVEPPINPITYTVTIRYRLSSDGKSDTLKNAYYKYVLNASTGEYEKVTFYEKTYMIHIDRQAPTENINNLIAGDPILAKFTTGEKSDYFVHFRDGGVDRKAYYTYQYREYYDNIRTNYKTDMGKVFAFKVSEDTEFFYEPNSKVYIKAIDPTIDTLSLPILSTSSYKYGDKISTLAEGETKRTFGKLFSSDNTLEKATGYYEILEIDMAGNTTQYIVYYQHSKGSVVDVIDLSFNITKPQTGTGTNLPINLGSNSTIEQSVSVYTIENNSAEIEGYGYYYITIEDKDDKVTTFTINVKTDLNQINEGIASVISSKWGGYDIEIRSTGIVFKYSIECINPEDAHRLTIRNVVEGNKINLQRFLEIDPNTNIRYYATNFLIKQGENAVEYKYKEFNALGEIIYEVEESFGAGIDIENLSGTYQIFAVDTLGVPYDYRFNTENSEEYEFSKVLDEFDGKDIDYYYYYKDSTKTYYSFGDFYIWYDVNVYSEAYVNIDCDRSNYEWDTARGIIRFKANTEDKNTGINYSARVDFRKNSSIDDLGGRFDWWTSDENPIDNTFNIVVNTDLGLVQLKNNGNSYEMDEQYYGDLNSSVSIDKSYTGVMSLSWTKIAENSYFDYQYTLYEQVDDKYEKIQIAEGSNAIAINTNEGGAGLYKFIITVWSKPSSIDEDPVIIGTKLYVFLVKSEGNYLYEVIDKTGTKVDSNSSFTLSDIDGLLGRKSLSAELAAIRNTVLKDGVNYPLYITNKDLDVTVINGVTCHEAIDLYDGMLNLYFVTAGSYGQCLLIFKLPNNNGDLTKSLNLMIDDNDPTTADLLLPLEENIVANPTDKIFIKGIINKLVNTNDTEVVSLLNKNRIAIDIFYNDADSNFATSLLALDPTTNSFSFEILGNGPYTFSIRDLAGNEQIYEDLTNKLKLNVYREVAVTITNDDKEHTPVDNAYYNGDVTLNIINAVNYVTGSIEIYVYKDGDYYSLEQSSHVTFTEYGYYEIIINAKYFDGFNAWELTNSVRFSILNEKEARESIDLTSLSSYEIVKVEDINGKDCTEVFLNEVIRPHSPNGMMINYVDLLSKADILNVSTGKLMYYITYRVDETTKMYPSRSIKFAFSLNNEIPNIKCSLDYGESSTKGFNITFNAGAIYDQVGESYIIIRKGVNGNSERVAEINESSSFGQTKISKSFKSDGAGDYYIQLVSTSGIVLNSYKVTIKEPLNTWAIILIVVITVVVATVAIVIIVLRRKMRIR